MNISIKNNKIKMEAKLLTTVFLVFLFNIVNGYRSQNKDKSEVKLEEVFSWKQIGYDFDGMYYLNSTDSEQWNDASGSMFFIQYNNVPIGMEVFGERVFVTVPRRRHGIPSTLNYVYLDSSSSPLLKPYPDPTRSRELVSVYRPRVDACGRLWLVDTGLLEIPDARKQIQPPAIIIFDLKTNEQILRHELKGSDLMNERTSGGLTSITVDVTCTNCDDAYAYINDLATEGLIVFSLAKRESWRFNQESFKHDESALNFTVAGLTITWKDGLFSVALGEPDENGKRVAYYHPLVSTQEFSIDTDILKNKDSQLDSQIKLIGSRGPRTQSGSHAYHEGTRTLLFANVAQDAILCWNIDTELTPSNVAIVAQDLQKLVYISDLKIAGDDVWVLVNQIPKFVLSTLDPNETNYFVHRGKIQNLIKGTVCDRSRFSHEHGHYHN